MTHPLAQASFAGCDAPHPALRAFAARQDTNAAFAAHEYACFAGFTNGGRGMGNGERGTGARSHCSDDDLGVAMMKTLGMSLDGATQV